MAAINVPEPKDDLETQGDQSAEAISLRILDDDCLMFQWIWVKNRFNGCSRIITTTRSCCD